MAYGEQLLVEAKDCWDLYDKLARLVFNDDADRHGLHASVRRIMFGLRAHVKCWDMKSMPPISEFGYRGTQKMAQLRKNYRNEEEVQRVKKIIQADIKKGTRPITSRTLLLKGVEQKATGQDHCMTTVTFHVPKMEPAVRVDVVYRTTEVAKKFPADLFFLDELFRDVLGSVDKPLLVRFYFISLYGSSVFWPIFGLVAKRIHIPSCKTWFTKRCVVELQQAVDNIPIKFMQKERVHKYVRKQIRGSDAMRDRVRTILDRTSSRRV